MYGTPYLASQKFREILQVCIIGQILPFMNLDPLLGAPRRGKVSNLPVKPDETGDSATVMRYNSQISLQSFLHWSTDPLNLS